MPEVDQPVTAPSTANKAARRVMAFDFGMRRIGVAIGQSLLGTASPVTVLPANDGVPDWTQLARLIAEWQPDLFVVGLPLNMDASESDLCDRARRFARRLQGRFHLDYDMMDERLTSVAVRDALLAGEGQRHFLRQSVDDLAAVLILESWFATQANHPSV